MLESGQQKPFFCFGSSYTLSSRITCAKLALNKHLMAEDIKTWQFTSGTDLPIPCLTNSLRFSRLYFLHQERKHLDQDSEIPKENKMADCRLKNKSLGTSEIPRFKCCMKHVHRLSRMIEIISFMPNNLETISRGTDVSDKITVCEKNPPTHSFCLLTQFLLWQSSSVSLGQRKVFSPLW